MDTSPSSLSPLEIRFHIGHLYELQGNFYMAKDMYESILSSEGSTVKLCVLKQDSPHAVLSPYFVPTTPSPTVEGKYVTSTGMALPFLYLSNYGYSPDPESGTPPVGGCEDRPQ
eukprot:sb/3476872/